MTPLEQATLAFSKELDRRAPNLNYAVIFFSPVGRPVVVSNLKDLEEFCKQLEQTVAEIRAGNFTALRALGEE